MKRTLCAVGAAIALMLTAGTGTALAGPIGSLPGGQSETVANTTKQDASQENATVNAPVNVALLNGGDVDQSNGGVQNTNGNVNGTGQDVSQSEQSSQSSGSQSEETSNSTDQSATQSDPTVNAPINVAVGNGALTPGCSCQRPSQGDVEQSNGGVQNTNGNVNLTGQRVQQDEQSQGRSAGQDEQVSNETTQTATQSNPTVNTPVNIATSGDVKPAYDGGKSGSFCGCDKGGYGKGGGDVEQSNGGVQNTNGNVNLTDQNVRQSETSVSGHGKGDYGDGRYGKPDSSCGCGSKDGFDKADGSSSQEESVSNETTQTASQWNPTVNTPINVASSGGDKPASYDGAKSTSFCGCDKGGYGKGGGDVEQSNGGVQNTNGNVNLTDQDVRQFESSQSGQGKGDYGKSRFEQQDGSSSQEESVSNETTQTAGQWNPTVNTPINVSGGGAFLPVWGFGKGGGVEQSNGGVENANGNVNLTDQDVRQSETSESGHDKGGYGTSPQHEHCSCPSEPGPRSNPGSHCHQHCRPHCRHHQHDECGTKGPLMR